MSNTKPNLINLKHYLVVSEYNTTGYIIDTFDEMDEAEKLLRHLVDKHNPTTDCLYEQQMGCLSYKIHPTAVYSSGNFINQITNGSYSVMIYSTHREGFTIEQLIYERGNTIYAIAHEQVSDDNKFIKDYHPDLLAN